MASSIICLFCKKNNCHNDSFMCLSCELEYPYCYDCGEKERNVPYKLCLDCYSKSGRTDRTKGINKQSLLSRLDAKKAEYQHAYKLFTSSWVKYLPVPEPSAIFAVSNSRIWESFQDYVQDLKTKDADATTDYFFHGTTLQCDLLKGNISCADPNCGICGIVTRGFDKSLIGKNIPRFKRYGEAFYLAPNSSKCHDYTQGKEDIGMRAQVLCLVACGTKFETMKDHTRLVKAPENCDSVYGNSGGTLNYEEVAVYESRAIFPEFVIVYCKDGVQKIAK